MIAPGTKGPEDNSSNGDGRLNLGVATAAAVPGPVRSNGESTTATRSLLEVAWRNRLLIAITTVLSVSAALAYVFLATPEWTATARLCVEQVGPKVMDSSAASVDTSKADTFLYTQSEFIKSSPVLDKAVETVWKSRPKAFETVSNPGAFLKKAMEVTVGKKDSLISVALQLPDPKEAVLIVNAVVDAYISKYAEQKRSTSVELVKILAKEKDKRDAECDQRRAEIDRFRKDNPMLSIGDEHGNVMTDRCVLLSTNLTQAQVDLASAKERVEQFSKLRTDPKKRAKLLEAALAQGTIKEDEFLKQQIHTQELALATETRKYDEGHPKVREIKEPLDELRKRAKEQQEAMLDAYLDGVQQENIIQTKLAETKVEKLKHDYDEELKKAMDAMVKASAFPFLKDDLDRSERRADTVMDRIMDFSVMEDVGALNITVMEPAEASERPTSPKRARTLALGLIGGLMLGFGLALLRDFLDHRLRSVDEMTGLLELPLLGVLPHVSNKLDRSAKGQLVAARPRSETAEAFRTLRTAIYFGVPEGQAKTILVTSPSPGDGKSTVASNLAIAMAQNDQSVLLIEADFRKPTQKLIFGVEASRGLAKVLTDGEPLDDAIMTTEIKGLSLLPCGPIPQNPVEILNSSAFRQALDELSQRYDKIIIDAPPVVPVADARVLGAICDITLLVLRAEKSTRRHAMVARDELFGVGAKILGIVVNSAPIGKGPYGYGRYGYGRYGRYERYGGYGRYGDGAADTHYKYDDEVEEKVVKA